MSILGAMNNFQQYAHSALHSYVVRAVLPAQGVMIISNAYRTESSQNIMLAPLISNNGNCGVHVTAENAISSIKQGTASSNGPVVLGNTYKCSSNVPAPQQQQLGMYPQCVCISAKYSKYRKQIIDLLCPADDLAAINIQVRGTQLQNAWQGDYNIRDKSSCAGLFFGHSLILIQGGKFCSVGLGQADCKLWMQALTLQVTTPGTLALTQNRQQYTMYTPNPAEALGYLQKCAFSLQKKDDDEYMYINEAGDIPASGLYRTYTVNSAALGATIQTIVVCPAKDQNQHLVTNATALRVLYSRWLDHNTGSCRVFSKTQNMTIVGARGPGAIYWQAAGKQTIDRAETSSIEGIKRQRAEHPALSAMFLQEQFQIPVQYLEANAQLTNTRILQYKKPTNNMCPSMLLQTEDGSIILRDGYGSQIRMTGGNIYISAAQHVYIQPRRSVLMMPGQAFACTAESIQLSGTDSIAAISGADVNIIAGASSKTDQPGQAAAINLSGPYVRAVSSKCTVVHTTQLNIAGVTNEGPCAITVQAGNSDIYVEARRCDIRAAAGATMRVSGSGFTVTQGSTIISGSMCTCTGALRLSASPQIGLSGSSHVLYAQTARLGYCQIYGALAVKHDIYCHSISAFSQLVVATKPARKSEDDYVLQGTFTQLQAIRYTATASSIPKTHATLPTDVREITLWVPTDGWQYKGYMYSWQRQDAGASLKLSLTVPEIKGIQKQAIPYPGDLQSTQYYVLNDKGDAAIKKTLKEYKI